MEVIGADAAILHAARMALRKLREQALHTSSKNPLAFELGMLAEACDSASDGLFNVLNLAHSYLGDETVEPYLHSKLEVKT